MTDQFREGLEAAALTIEQEDCGLVGGAFLKALAEKVRSLTEGSALVVSDHEVAWLDFRDIYKSLGGTRNNWKAGHAKFMSKIKKDKHHPSAIISGTLAYRATHPEPQYVPAVEVFLNKEKFMTEWRPVPPSPNGRESLFDVGRELNGR